MRIGYAIVNRLSTRYYHAGEGPPVIFVHGLGAGSDTWVRNLDPVGDAGFRAFAPDLPGHGFSDGIELGGRLPQPLLVEHLLGFMASQALERAHFVGSAFGALLAVLLHFQQPSRVMSLTLVGSGSVFHPSDSHGSMIDASIANQTRALENPTRDTIRSRNVGSNFDRSDPFEEIVLTQLNIFAKPDRLRIYREMTAGMRASMGTPECQAHHRLEQIRCPTLVISGDSDPRADAARVAVAARRIPSAEVCILERCGHKPFSEKSAEFNQGLTAFLKRQG